VADQTIPTDGDLQERKAHVHRGSSDGVLWRSIARTGQPRHEREAMLQYLLANRLPPEQVTSVECYLQDKVLKLRVEMLAVTDGTTAPWTEQPATTEP
jgi:hypothetical protein